jgi:hypothetical protein
MATYTLAPSCYPQPPSAGSFVWDNFDGPDRAFDNRSSTVHLTLHASVIVRRLCSDGGAVRYLMSTLLASQWLSTSSIVIATLLRSMRGWGLTTLLID